MGLRFFKRIRIAPGLSLNMSKSGPSISFGPRGMKYTVGPRGTRQTFGLPGTGLSYTTTNAWGKRGQPSRVPSGTSVPSSLDLGFLQRIVTPPEEEQLVAGLKQYLSGQNIEALNTFRSCITLQDAVFLSGFLALGQGFHAEAEKAFLQCLASVSTLGRIIQKYIQGFHLSLRITEYVDAPIDVDSRGVNLALAETHQTQGNFDRAIQIVKNLWNANPTDLVVCLSLSDLIVANPASSRQDLENVVKLITGVVNDAPIHANLLYLRGAAMYRIQLADAATKQFSELLRKKKDRPEALLRQIRYFRGRLYENAGQSTLARKDYQLIYAEDPSYKDVASRVR